MASSVIFKIDQKSAQEFQSLLKEMQSVTGKDMKIVIRNAGRDFARLAKKETPEAGTTITGKKVRTRGFAKAGWAVALIGLRKSAGGEHKRGGRTGLRFGELKDGLNKPAAPFVVITNRIPYIEELPGQILAHTISRVNAQMARTLSRDSRRKWRSTWKR